MAKKQQNLTPRQWIFVAIIAIGLSVQYVDGLFARGAIIAGVGIAMVGVWWYQRGKPTPAIVARCDRPDNHNLPDMRPTSKCRGCGRTVEELANPYGLKPVEAVR